MNDEGRHDAVPTASFVVAAALAGLLGLATGCENSDPIAPEGSSIIVTANPQTVNPGQSTMVTATLRSGNGTRLPDQEVLFSSTRGTLKPVAQTPILTDSQGQATSELLTTERTTVTASSGSISGTTEVTVSSCAIASISLTLSAGSIDDCSTPVTITLLVEDTNGQPCEDLPVVITAQRSTSGADMLDGFINPSQGLTDAVGEFSGTFTPDSTSCTTNCDATDCEVDFVGSDTTGFKSQPVTLRENFGK